MPDPRPANQLLMDIARIDLSAPTDPGNAYQVPAVAVVHASLWREIADALERLRKMEGKDA